MRRLGAISMLVVALAGCGVSDNPSLRVPDRSVVTPSVPAAGEATPMPGDRTSAATSEARPPTALPTTGSQLTAEEAGAALLTAQARYQEAMAKANANVYADTPCAGFMEPCTLPDLPLGTEHWSKTAAALDAYIAGLDTIAFPDVAVAEATVFIQALSSYRDAAAAAGEADTVESFLALAEAASDSRDNEVGDLEGELLDALGLPVGP